MERQGYSDTPPKPEGSDQSYVDESMLFDGRDAPDASEYDERISQPEDAVDNPAAREKEPMDPISQAAQTVGITDPEVVQRVLVAFEDYWQRQSDTSFGEVLRSHIKDEQGNAGLDALSATELDRLAAELEKMQLRQGPNHGYFHVLPSRQDNTDSAGQANFPEEVPDS